MAKLVSKVYGDALFEAATDKGDLDTVWDEIRFIKALIQENRDFDLLMTHPGMTEELKEASIREIFDHKITDTTMGFLLIVIQKGRFSDLEDIIDYVDNRIKEHKKIGIVYVKTADELNAQEKENIEQRLIEVTSYETLETHYEIDTDLIAGIVIRIGDRVLDNSVSSKIKAMKKKLSSIQMI